MNENAPEVSTQAPVETPQNSKRRTISGVFWLTLFLAIVVASSFLNPKNNISKIQSVGLVNYLKQTLSELNGNSNTVIKIHETRHCFCPAAAPFGAGF